MPKKQYIITSITLGLIAAASAAVIGLTNFITRDRIAANEVEKIKSGIKELFGESVDSYKEMSAAEAGLTGKYDYVKYVYEVKDHFNARLGYGFRTSGSNMYGKIALLVGFAETTHDFIGMSPVINEQTYAQTLQESYIDLVNDEGKPIDDVKCGATYGATLVRDMIYECKAATLELWKE